MAHHSKTFVIDTNVLLHDPKALLQFPRHHVLVPVAVLEELDKMKRLPNDLGKNSREAIRLLDSLKTMGSGNLHTGVKLDNGAVIRVQPELKVEYKYDFAMTINDNRIIMAAYLLQEQGEKVVFVSKDFAARIKANRQIIHRQEPLETQGMSLGTYPNDPPFQQGTIQGPNKCPLMILQNK